jgi:hypothetical protein
VLVHSVLVERAPKHGVGYSGESVGEKVKLLLNGSHLAPQGVRLQRPRGDDNME